MTSRISEKLRQEVAMRSNYRCEYCLMPELFMATTFHIDHIISQKHGGATILENLAYTCPHCNQNKGSDIATVTTDGEQIIRFFNPRKDSWLQHFYLQNAGNIVGLTDIGNATVRILNFNQIERVILRKNLIQIGVYTT